MRNTTYDEQLICKLYTEGKSIKFIERELGCSHNLISRVLRDNKIEKRSIYKELNLTDTEIVRKYQSGLSVNAVAELAGCSHHPIERILKKNNIQIRDLSESHRIYDLNESFFDSFNPNMAYILGLFYADGYVSSSRNTIGISLQDRDRHILEEICGLIFNDVRPLNFRKKKNDRHRNMYRFSIHSDRIKSKLISLGVVPNKTLIIEYPKDLPEELNAHFIRGYFDGDGSIVGGKTKITNITFSLTSSSYRFLEVVQEKMVKDIGLNYTKIGKSHTAWSLTYGGKKQNQKIYDYLYSNAELRLNRKHEKYTKLLNRY